MERNASMLRLVQELMDRGTEKAGCRSGRSFLADTE